MSSKVAVPAVVVTRRRSKWRISGVLAAIVLVVFLAVAAWLFSIAHSALPELDGTIAVRGISGPVSVIRDTRGIPTIEATTLENLFFAQGYITAQDRLFQMDLLRRAAAGELSEVIGEAALKHDRQQRILGLRAQAEKALATATPQDLEQFAAYAGGVNAYIDSHRNRLPLEFRLLHYAPHPWTTQDSLVIAYQMIETLSTSPQAALTREKILAKLGPDLTSDLYVNSSWRDHPPTVPVSTLDAVPPERQTAGNTLAAGKAAPAVLRPLLQPFFRDQQPAALGSNNWVVSGTHTVSGKPLLSNDMHLGHQMPNLWYEAHLHCGDFDVAGVTLPGYPYVIVGHNRRVAWGFTNIGPTVEDVFIETFNAAGQYLTPDGWKQPEIRHQVIHVKGKPDVTLEVRGTRHGPIVTELAPGETRPIALRWTLYDGVRNPFFNVDSAENWDQFRRALSEFDAPGQNVVYADVEGNIGYQATGRVPRRASGDGSLPVDGSTNAHEWIGYIAYDKMPSKANPPSGFVGTANARITPDGYPYSISVEWEAPWRVARIYHVLQSGKKFAASDMLALQTDIDSELDRVVSNKLVYAVDHARAASARAKEAADILRNWNGQMTADSAAPTIASRGRQEIKRLLLEPKLGPAPEGADPAILSWRSYHWMMETVWLDNVLSHQPAQWLPANYSSYDDLLAAAMENVLREAPKDLPSWRWGPQQSVTIQNPVLGRIPLLRRWTGPGEKPQSGSGYTVKASGRDYGPSERFTADLSDLDASTLNVVTGQSGNFLSPHYMDQWDAWYTGYTFVLPFSKTAVENAARHRLMLVPR
jgi:penicillin G amidase